MTDSPKQRWRDVLSVHPAADLFPMMSENELKALGEDIKKNGLRNRVAVLDGPNGEPILLDGRNRLDAMELVGLEIVLAKVTALPTCANPYAYVISANIHRRHLTTEQKRDLIEKLLKAKPDQSNRVIAKQVNVDHKTVGAVRTEMESTGEIPQLDRTIGADGKARPQLKRAGDVVPVEPEDDEDADIEPHFEADIEPENYRGAFLIRADLARQMAVYSGPVDEDVIGMAQVARDAWHLLASKLDETEDDELDDDDDEGGDIAPPDEIEQNVLYVIERAIENARSSRKVLRASATAAPKLRLDREAAERISAVARGAAAKWTKIADALEKWTTPAAPRGAA